MTQLLVQPCFDLCLDFESRGMQSCTHPLQLLDVLALILLKLRSEMAELHVEGLLGDGLCDSALHTNVLTLQMSQGCGALLMLLLCIFFKDLKLGL